MHASYTYITGSQFGGITLSMRVIIYDYGWMAIFSHSSKPAASPERAVWVT